MVGTDVQNTGVQQGIYISPTDMMTLVPLQGHQSGSVVGINDNQLFGATYADYDGTNLHTLGGIGDINGSGIPTALSNGGADSGIVTGIFGDGSATGWVGSWSGLNIGVSHAAIWDPSHTLIILDPSSTLSQANGFDPNSRTVVGALAGSTAYRWVEQADGSIRAFDLNTEIQAGSPWHLSTAVGILGDGRIYGTGTYNGQATSFILTPVPEPFSLIGVAIGSLILVTRRRAY
ncbi:MAG: PEP-CTERM sorting domain-containing protein [Fimbriimonadales bacterium]